MCTSELTTTPQHKLQRGGRTDPERLPPSLCLPPPAQVQKLNPAGVLTCLHLIEMECRLVVNHDLDIPKIFLMWPYCIVLETIRVTLNTCRSKVDMLAWRLR